MVRECAPVPAEKTAEALHKSFCARILPAVERHARFSFRYLPWHDRTEAVAEACALAFLWCQRLEQQGKDGGEYPSALATFAVRHVKAGRFLVGQESGTDAMSGVAQRRHGFTVSKLPDCSTLTSNPLEAALVDDMQTPIPDQVAFRCDFPTWLARWGKRDQNMILDLAQGERTLDAAKKYHLSPGRVSQMRREAAEDWEAFHGMAA